MESLWAAQTQRGEFFRRITGHTRDFVQKILNRSTLLQPDLLAMAVAIDPEIVTLAEDRHVEVELAGNHTRGQTSVDWMGVRHQETNVRVILEMDRARIWELTQLAVS